jgi:hypothetical protein
MQCTSKVNYRMDGIIISRQVILDKHQLWRKDER